ncbi:MAG: hypothetical protein KME32_30535 [Mojavia pulchra JT2-VF2]|uniref:Uncharacterized protein n=1 Tax=Mojavia pulchra JT2-VF2 TaxID=287848 RepID=A0A951Q5W3_9NOST|nr:hypothetical protein [Mojavia pulchra JT2-VF2]
MSHPNLHILIDAAQLILEEIARHPDYQALDYQPDLTIVDAQTALSYLIHATTPLESFREATPATTV